MSTCPHMTLVFKRVEYVCDTCGYAFAGMAELAKWQNHVFDLNRLRKAVETIRTHRESWKATEYLVPKGWTEQEAAAYRKALDFVMEQLDPMDFMEELRKKLAGE